MCVSTDVAISNYFPTNTLLPAASCWLLNYGKERILGEGKKKVVQKVSFSLQNCLRNHLICIVPLCPEVIIIIFLCVFFFFFYSAVVYKSSVVWPKCWVLTALILLYLSPTVLLTWQGHWKEKKKKFFSLRKSGTVLILSSSKAGSGHMYLCVLCSPNLGHS